jgi:hypothetical protein
MVCTDEQFNETMAGTGNELGQALQVAKRRLMGELVMSEQDAKVEVYGLLKELIHDFIKIEGSSS